jgi:hypothetical protein
VTVGAAPATDKTLVSLSFPSPVTGLPNGAAKTAAALGLPSAVTLVTDGGNVAGGVIWEVASSSYDPAETSEQTFTVSGTATLPSGVVNPDDVSLTVIISVTVGAYTGGGSTGGGSTGGGSTVDTTTPPVTEETTVLDNSEVPLSALFPFSDVKTSDWYYGNVYYVWEHSLVNGTVADKFSPDISLTRGMIATILYRNEGEPSVAGQSDPFIDVAAGAWYADAVKWGAANGVVKGIGGGRFDPDTPVSRQDLAAILYRYVKLKGLTLPEAKAYAPFGDEAEIADYAKEAVAAFFMAEVINGKNGGVFDPKGTAIRAEVAAMMHRFLESVK